MGKRSCGRGGGGLRVQGGAGIGGGACRESVKQSLSTKTSTVPRRASGESFLREKVVGECRVWGTAVHSAIKRFCGIESDHANGNHQWWFVIHDDESVLSDLDTKWNLVQVQISWKLELRYTPTVPVPHPDNIDVYSHRVNKPFHCCRAQLCNYCYSGTLKV